MTQPETRVQQAIQKAIKPRGWFVFKVHGSEYMMAGLPDLIICAEGLFIGLEVKVPDKRDNTSARQDYVHEKIREAGGAAHVVCSPAEAIDLIEATLRLRKQK